MKKTTYAATTTVSVEKSQAEIQTTLRKYGANKFGTMEDGDKAYVMFEYKGLAIQMDVPLPVKSDFIKTDAGRSRKESQVTEAYDQAIKQKWRGLFLSVKSKLVSIDTGVSTIEKEFLAFVRMPNGKSLGEFIIPQLEAMVETGKMPKMLSITMQ